MTVVKEETDLPKCYCCQYWAWYLEDLIVQNWDPRGESKYRKYINLFHLLLPGASRQYLLNCKELRLLTILVFVLSFVHLSVTFFFTLPLMLS